MTTKTKSRYSSKHDVQFLLNTTPTLESSLTPSDIRKLRNTCHICGHCFAQTADVRKHIRTVHHGERPFKCDKCGKSFGEKGNLHKHQKSVHLNERPFKCAKCTSSFAFKDGLARHIKLVHDKVRPFSCNRCGNSYKQVSQLRRHAVNCVCREVDE